MLLKDTPYEKRRPGVWPFSVDRDFHSFHKINTICSKWKNRGTMFMYAKISKNCDYVIFKSGKETMMYLNINWVYILIAE